MGLEPTKNALFATDHDNRVAPCAERACENSRGVGLAGFDLPGPVPDALVKTPRRSHASKGIGRGAKRGASHHTPGHIASLVRRFWLRADRSGGETCCWIWRGAVDKDGYGRTTIAGVRTTSHRVAWWITRGEWPSTLVCHHCDNPACVNPSHMFLGTSQENSYDRHRKGRDARGVGNGMSKMTPADVQAVRTLARQNVTHRDIARRFGLSKTTVSYAVSGRTWAHLGEAE